ncbi:MAG: glycosyltransferase [Saprospiraceae bacterium]|nr:glycosyltransferase [Saprospiraceae bacterium]
MKILMVIDSMYRGGRERRMLELLRAFTLRPQIQVNLVILSEVVTYPEVFHLGYPIHILKRKTKKDPRIFTKIYKICQIFRPNLIHSWGTMSTIFAIPTSKMLGITLINANIADAPHDMSLFDSRFVRAQLTFPFSKIILSNSEAGLKSYRAPKHKSTCIHNGFDLTRIQQLEEPLNIRKKYHILDGQLIGMVGGFYDRKDYFTFIKAAILLLDQDPTLNFIGIGNGPNLEECQNLVPKKHKERILLPGQIERVEAVINVFNIGVLCTNETVHGEGISNSIMEYMALGKPVVATRGGGTPEIISDGITGFLVRPNDSVELASKIKTMLADNQLTRRMGDEGRNRIHKDFLIQQMESKYINLYESLLKAQNI